MRLPRLAIMASVRVNDLELHSRDRLEKVGIVHVLHGFDTPTRGELL
jgi:hypothetical protein